VETGVLFHLFHEAMGRGAGRACRRDGGDSIIDRAGSQGFSGAAFVAALALSLAMPGSWPARAAAAPAPAAPAPGQTASVRAIPEADRVRLAEAFRMGRRLGDRLWKGWHKAPFAILLVTPRFEYLVRHPRPPAEFVRLGRDASLGGDVYAAPRDRGHAITVKATFPINGVPTIVVGQAEHTEERISTRWVVLLMHEHFHQLQFSAPGYAEGLEELKLVAGAGAGSAAMTLNYPFPYDATAVAARFAPMRLALSDAFGAIGTADLPGRLAAYRRARDIFLQGLGPTDRRYFAFQSWQEGVAQYTQCRVAELAAAVYEPTAEFSALDDYTPFAEEARRLRETLRGELPNVRLEEYRRIAFYYVGAAEAFVLDAVEPRWRRRYFARPFSLDAHLDATGYTPDSAASPSPRR
jgi:hypothetical protein